MKQLSFGAAAGWTGFVKVPKCPIDKVKKLKMCSTAVRWQLGWWRWWRWWWWWWWWWLWWLWWSVWWRLRWWWLTIEDQDYDMVEQHGYYQDDNYYDEDDEEDQWITIVMVKMLKFREKKKKKKSSLICRFLWNWIWCNSLQKGKAKSNKEIPKTWMWYSTTRIKTETTMKSMNLWINEMIKKTSSNLNIKCTCKKLKKIATI